MRARILDAGNPDNPFSGFTGRTICAYTFPPAEGIAIYDIYVDPLISDAARVGTFTGAQAARWVAIATDRVHSDSGAAFAYRFAGTLDTSAGFNAIQGCDSRNSPLYGICHGRDRRRVAILSVNPYVMGCNDTDRGGLSCSAPLGSCGRTELLLCHDFVPLPRFAEERNWTRTIMHELGHAIGLKHPEDEMLAEDCGTREFLNDYAMMNSAGNRVNANLRHADINYFRDIFGYDRATLHFFLRGGVADDAAQEALDLALRHDDAICPPSIAATRDGFLFAAYTVPSPTEDEFGSTCVVLSTDGSTGIRVRVERPFGDRSDHYYRPAIVVAEGHAPRRGQVERYVVAIALTSRRDSPDAALQFAVRPVSSDDDVWLVLNLTTAGQIVTTRFQWMSASFDPSTRRIVVSLQGPNAELQFFTATVHEAISGASWTKTTFVEGVFPFGGASMAFGAQGQGIACWIDWSREDAGIEMAQIAVANDGQVALRQFQTAVVRNADGSTSRVVSYSRPGITFVRQSLLSGHFVLSTSPKFGDQRVTKLFVLDEATSTWSSRPEYPDVSVSGPDERPWYTPAEVASIGNVGRLRDLMPVVSTARTPQGLHPIASLSAADIYGSLAYVSARLRHHELLDVAAGVPQESLVVVSVSPRIE